MTKAVARVTLLALLLSCFTFAKFLVNDYIITPKAAVAIDKMGQELTQKTGINAYIIATTDNLEVGANLYEYSKKYESNISKPSVIFIFAPNALITSSSEQKGRMGIIPSSDKLKDYYDSDSVKKFAIDILKSNDSNSLQSKYDLAVAQAYSELCDEIADYKGVSLENTLKDRYGWIIDIFTWIVRIGALLLLWIYLVRPLLARIRNVKK